MTIDSRLSRRGYTLIELLIVIMIISILAALVIGVAAIAGETAREAQSRHMVQRLHTLLTEYYDTYKTRRVNVRQAVLDGIAKQTNLGTAQKGQAVATARLYALRELLLMEVPDRWSDILLTDVPQPPTGLSDALYPYYQDSTGGSTSGRGRSSLANVYLRRYAAIATRTNSITGLPNTAEEITDYQGAECLYMIITQACGDGEARTLFAESTIGDVDGDGAPEFLDGWGHPVNFLRWAPGFDSQIQINANNYLPLPVSSAWKAAAAKDHDPFDVFRMDEPAFRLVPLIYSGGRDETYSLRLVKPWVALRGRTQPQLNAEAFNPPNPNRWPAILPYAQVTDTDGAKVFLGTDNGENASADNIHNHLLGLR